MFEEAYQAPWT